MIESFILNVPIPPIFLYEVDYSIYEVIDGLQRLTAIYDFYKGKFNLEGLEYWRELDLLYIKEENNKFLFDGRYNNRKDIEARIKYFQEFLQGFIS